MQPGIASEAQLLGIT